VRIDVDSLKRLPLPTWLLGASCVLLGAAIVTVAIRGTRSAELLATAATPPTALAIDVSTPARGADLAPIQSRPLLYATRSFYTKPAAPISVAPPRPDYRLAGVMVLPGKPAVALLSPRQPGAGRRVRQGDDVGGWRVQAVTRNQVTFGWELERFELTTSPPPVSAGIKRIPMNRSRMASSVGGIQSLGAVGDAGTVAPAAAGIPPDRPRLYLPPNP